MKLLKNNWRLLSFIALIIIGISIYINMQTKIMPEAMYIEPDYRWYGIRTLSIYSESDKDKVEITLKNEDRDKITELINNTTVSAFEVPEPENAKKIVTQTAVAGNGIPFDFSIHKTRWGNYYLHIESLDPPVGIWHKIKESDLPDYYIELEKVTF